MATVLSERGTHIQLACTSTADTFLFMTWLKDHSEQCKAIKHLDIGNDDVDDLPSPDARISLCSLHEAVGRLPNLEGLHLRGLFLVECTIANHEHVPPPSALFLTNITLDRVATALPFELDPVPIIEFTPRLTSVRITNCRAVGDEVVYWTTHDSTTLSGPLPFPPIALSVTFPPLHRDHLQYYNNSTREWSDFATRIRHDRGTRAMHLENVHDDVYHTVATLINNNSDELEELQLDFSRCFQSTFIFV